jgi:uncharacterized membrane protein
MNFIFTAEFWKSVLAGVVSGIILMLLGSMFCPPFAAFSLYMLQCAVLYVLNAGV